MARSPGPVRFIWAAVDIAIATANAALTFIVVGQYVRDVGLRTDLGPDEWLLLAAGFVGGGGVYLGIRSAFDAVRSGPRPTYGAVLASTICAGAVLAVLIWLKRLDAAPLLAHPRTVLAMIAFMLARYWFSPVLNHDGPRSDGNRDRRNARRSGKRALAGD